MGVGFNVPLPQESFFLGEREDGPIAPDWNTFSTSEAGGHLDTWTAPIILGQSCAQKFLSLAECFAQTQLPEFCKGFYLWSESQGSPSCYSRPNTMRATVAPNLYYSQAFLGLIQWDKNTCTKKDNFIMTERPQESTEAQGVWQASISKLSKTDQSKWNLICRCPTILLW